MDLSVQPVRSEGELSQFITFPWVIYQDDPYWVPPLLADRRARLDPERSPFWKNASRELFLARLDGQLVGTIAAIIDKTRVACLGAPVGTFGFFECINDPRTASALVAAAEGWLRERGMTSMRGSFNPTDQDEAGILVEGFDTRPALKEGHNPAYYKDLLEGCGMRKHHDMLARLWERKPGCSMEEQYPGKLLRAAARAARRPDLRVRQMDVRRWDEEIGLAYELFKTSLQDLPEYVPVSLEDFRALAASFRRILDPRLALVGEISGKPVGFVLALPDANQALQKILSHTTPRGPGLLDMLRLFFALRRLTRVTFKILVVLPEYQGRGVEAVLSAQLGRAIWEMGFCEVDMSLTGEENVKSNRFQENLGFRVYRRYRVYQKELI